MGSYWYADSTEDQEATEIVGLAMRALDCTLSGGGFADVSGMRGFPVRVITRAYRREGTLEASLELVHLRTREIDPDEFSLPEGYKKINGIPWTFSPY
jgi:hypothetical protein